MIGGAVAVPEWGWHQQSNGEQMCVSSQPWHHSREEEILLYKYLHNLIYSCTKVLEDGGPFQLCARYDTFGLFHTKQFLSLIYLIGRFGAINSDWLKWWFLVTSPALQSEFYHKCSARLYILNKSVCVKVVNFSFFIIFPLCEAFEQIYVV